jgi:hypothetical protein
MTGDGGGHDDESVLVRFGKLSVSIVVLTGVTVVVGYGGWALLTISAKLGGPDPETTDGDLLRKRLLAWPERNREFMRNNGHGDLPLKP